MFFYLFIFLLSLTLSNTIDESFLSFLKGLDEDDSNNERPYVIKSVLATTNYLDAFNSIMYMLPTVEEQEITHVDCGDSAKEDWSDSMFQLHQPYVPIHSSGIFQPPLVEMAFYQKWINYQQSVSNLNGDYSDISSLIYEPFFDHSFALYKNNIIDNIKVIQDQSNSNLNWKILYTFLKWNLQEEIDGKNAFISLLLNVPTTQVTIELITEYTNDYDQYLENEVVFETEPRMSFKNCDTYPWDSTLTAVPIKQSRYVSDIKLNVAWYQEFLDAKIAMSGVTEVNGRQVEYTNLYLDYAPNFEIGFYSRSSDDSYGEFTIDTYESGINSVHRDFILSSACGFNRWFDNHYAFDMIKSQEKFKLIYESIKESGQRYILFAYTSETADSFGKEGLESLGIDYFFLLYVVEPNGNTIQIVGYFEDDDLAYNTVQWDGTFCPEVCVDKPYFTKNWIDNGQYTSYGKTLEKYIGTLTNENDHDKIDKDEKIFAKSKTSKLLKKKSDKHKHKHIGGTNVPLALTVGIFSALTIFLFSTVVSKCKKCGKKKSTKSNNSTSDETTQLISSTNYGAIVV